MVAPVPIHTDEMSFSQGFSGLSETCSDNLEPDLETLEMRKNMRKESYMETREMSEEMQVSTGVPLGTLKMKTPCPKGVELLNKLKAALMQIPDNVPLATPAHRLSTFLANPHSWVTHLEQDPEDDFEDDWMVVNLMLKTVFGWGESNAQANMKGVKARQAFCQNTSWRGIP